MKTVFQSLIITGVFSVLSLTATAQDDNDYTNNRGKTDRKQDQNAINTRKKTPVKIIEYIVGTWQTDAIFKGKKEITGTDTVGSDRTIEFDREGRYVVYNRSEKADNGSYRLNENHSILYLESEAGQTPQEWKISLDENGLMTLQSTGTHQHAESFRYVYSRTSSADRSSDQQN